MKSERQFNPLSNNTFFYAAILPIQNKQSTSVDTAKLTEFGKVGSTEDT